MPSGHRVAGVIGSAAVLIAALSACVPLPWAAPAPGTDGPLQTTLVSVIDGDTVETTAGTVRLIGIDTPERGECGYAEASAALAELIAPGDTVMLDLPDGQNDTDRHDRLIRYVETTGGVDTGRAQLDAGHAAARYDSRDGYPAHPREADYHAAQQATLAPDGSVITAACQASAPAQPVELGERWWEQYTSCVKLRNNMAGHPTGPFSRDDPTQAEAYEWFAHGTGNNGDGDGDGWACE